MTWKEAKLPFKKKKKEAQVVQNNLFVKKTVWSAEITNTCLEKIYIK